MLLSIDMLEENIKKQIVEFKQELLTFMKNCHSGVSQDKKPFYAKYANILKQINTIKKPSDELLKFRSENTKLIINKYLQNPSYEFYRLLTQKEVKNFHISHKEDIENIQLIKPEEIKIPHIISSCKYIPKRDWQSLSLEKQYIDSIKFSKDLIDYKNYHENRYYSKYINVFKNMNDIIFEALDNLIAKIRQNFPEDTNIILCTCPSSVPGKANSLQFSINEYSTTHDNKIINCGDLLIRTKEISPSHLATDRSISNHLESIAINEQKYDKEFFNKNNIFIICDDIYTTGSTMNACKQIIMNNQNKTFIHDIFVYTIATTLNLYTPEVL